MSFRVNGLEAAWASGYDRSIPVGGMALVCADGGPYGSNAWKPEGAEGPFTVEAVVDPSGTITETVETNNTRSVRAEVFPRPPRNLALGHPVSVTSVERAGLEGANAVDGLAGTRWSSAFSDPQSITVDLGQVEHIVRVVLVWETAFGREYLVQTSTDGSTWSDAVHITDGDGGVDAIDMIADARYVRMTGLRRGTEWGYSLFEFEVYSDGGTDGTDGDDAPDRYRLHPVYPNPFRQTTTVAFDLPLASHVRIDVYDVAGRRIRILTDGERGAGEFTDVSWNGEGDDGTPLSSGVYIIRMEAGGTRTSQKAVLLK